MILICKTSIIKIMTIFVVSILALTSFSISSVADNKNDDINISLEYSFETPSIKKVVVNRTIYDKVVIEGAACFGDPGEPSLPVKGAYILLPDKTKVKNVKVIPSERVSLGSGFKVAPGGQPVPLSKINNASIPLLNETIYNSNDLFPGKLFSRVGLYSFRGYLILVLRLYPVQYLPASGELIYYKDLTISIETVVDDDIHPLYRGLEKDKHEVMKKVDNPTIIETYKENPPSTSLKTNDDLLIITTDELKTSFEELKQLHDLFGIKTAIKTLSDIKLVPGTVNPEDIRTFIQEAYFLDGIEYVLIGGDVEIVPAKILWVYGLDEEIKPYETYMPSDLYYSCLDGTFNYDGDGKWGEPTDGDNGGDVDLLADVYVGRACVLNEAEVENFIVKTRTYLEADMNSDSYLKDAVLAGEYLGYDMYGGDYLDQLIDESNADGYMTVGLPTKKYNVEKLYDREWQEGEWSVEEIIYRINNGVHIINHDGHSNSNYNMRMVISDVETLTNNQYCFVYSNGCDAGAFDSQCIAEYFTTKTAHGAFAGIWNARYGWFWVGSTDSDSQRFIREFWDAVFGENIPVISKANQDSKEDNLYIIDRSCIRWCYYQLNLFGDPAVAFHVGNPPLKPNKPTGPSNGKVNVLYYYNTSTIDPDGDPVWFWFDWGDGTNSGWIGSYVSGETGSASHIWNEKGDYEIRVKAKDSDGATSEWSDPLLFNILKNKETNNPLFSQFIESLLRYFPVFHKIIHSIFDNFS